MSVLIIAISEHEKQKNYLKLKNLEFPVTRDAKLFKKLLTEKLDVYEEDIIELTNENATADDID